ncbi:hypothetical protein MTR67_024409 [Solanum verrucosum]|uniref:RNase H type-1 domain-containing protein n=1 Tax=Solanum verrucosum TaxID=315347 RepID=A0AAF0R3R4_SOLVR|nr:hypothetical protein MTR67_024409 [Solanum verrucosum]
MVSPPNGTFKLNTDDSFLSTTEGGGIGGVIRDHKGYWIVGFSKHTFGHNDVMVEMEALLEGLNLAVNLNLNPIEIEIDFAEILQDLNHAHPIYATMVNDCWLLMKRLRNLVIHHNFRQANKVADFLSKMGAKLTPSIQDANISTPPGSAVAIVQPDKAGVSITKLISRTTCNKLACFGNLSVITITCDNVTT